jgi:hypothetical protein
MDNLHVERNSCGIVTGCIEPGAVINWSAVVVLDSSLPACAGNFENW